MNNNGADSAVSGRTKLNILTGSFEMCKSDVSIATNTSFQITPSQKSKH